MRKRKRLIGVILLPLFAQSVSPMQLPYPYATEFTQLAVYAKSAMQVIQTAQMIRMQIEMLRHSTLAGTLMTAFQWGQLANNIYALSRNIRQGQGLAYTMGNLDTVFRQAYPGYLQAGVAFGSQYQRWGHMNLDTIAGVLNSIGVAGSQLPNDVMIKDLLDKKAETAVGQDQILDATAQIASFQNDNLMKLRQIMLAQTTLIAQGQGAAVNKDLVDQQVTQQAIGPGDDFTVTN